MREPAQLVNFSRRTLKVEPDRRPSWGHASARVEPRDHAQVPESDPMTEWKTLLSDGVERSAQIGMRTRPTHSAAFRGRAIEWRQLGLLLDRVSTGESAALVVRGEAGIGKTALLDHCSGQAAGFQNCPDRGDAVRDGVAICRAASALRTDARRGRKSSGASAERAPSGVRPDVGRRS